MHSYEQGIPTFKPNQDPETWDGTFLPVSELYEPEENPMAKRQSAAGPLYDAARQMGRTAAAIQDMEDIMNGDIQKLLRRKARRRLYALQRKMANQVLGTARNSRASRVSAETEQAEVPSSTSVPER